MTIRRRSIDRRDAAGDVEQGAERGVRPAAAEAFQALLAAAHAGQPVVDQDHPREIARPCAAWHPVDRHDRRRQRSVAGDAEPRPV